MNYTLSEFINLMEDKNSYAKKINEKAVEINLKDRVVFEMEERKVDLRVIAENIGELRRSVEKLVGRGEMGLMKKRNNN